MDARASYAARLASKFFSARRRVAYHERVSTALGNLKSWGRSPLRLATADDISPDRELTWQKANGA